MPAKGFSDIPLTCQPKEADSDVPQGGHDLGRCPSAYLASVFIEGHIPYPVEPVLYAPVASPKLQKTLGRCFCLGKAGDRVGHLPALLPSVLYHSFQTTPLGKRGPIAVANQRVGGP